MTIDKYREDFETNFNGWDGYMPTTGKIDKNQEKAICFYNSKRALSYQGIIGGNKCRSTRIKPVAILLRYTKNQLNAEEMAKAIYDFYDERSFFIDNKRIFTKIVYNEPVDLGTDEFGVFEYSFELEFYEEV